VTAPVARGSLSGMKCFACAERQSCRGVLCDACASGLVAIDRLCPEQIQMRSASAGVERRGWLIDSFGHPHALASDTVVVGRDPRCELAIADLGISQLHAEMVYGAQSGAWLIADRGSRNGVRVNDEVVERTWLESGDRIFLGTALGFLFLDLDEARRVEAARELRRAADMPPPLATLGELVIADAGPDRSLELLEAEGGGLARVGAQTVQLSLLQLELLRLFSETRRHDGADDATAGFIASKRLLASGLSFETAQPTPTNLKRLIRSIRNKFTAAGVGEVIESRQNLGYRLLLSA
jgi:pSer/pThr/pTyr-binding forkhead associated (FHA) protein